MGFNIYKYQVENKQNSHIYNNICIKISTIKHTFMRQSYLDPGE